MRLITTTFDPDAALTEIRSLVDLHRQLLDDIALLQSTATATLARNLDRLLGGERIFELIGALDDHLAKGNALPQAWIW